MTIKQQINHDAIQKYITYIMTFSSHLFTWTCLTLLNLYQFYSINSPVSLTKNNNKLWNEKKKNWKI